VGSGAGIGGDSGVSLVQNVEGSASCSLGDSVNGAMEGEARELGLPIGSVLVKSPREVGFANSESIGAELWLIKVEPITLVESTVRLGSICEVWPSTSLVVSLKEAQSVALGVLGDGLWFVLVDMPEVFANSGSIGVG
jgi:hypothetical protein